MAGFEMNEGAPEKHPSKLQVMVNSVLIGVISLACVVLFVVVFSTLTQLRNTFGEGIIDDMDRGAAKSSTVDLPQVEAAVSTHTLD